VTLFGTHNTIARAEIDGTHRVNTWRLPQKEVQLWRLSQPLNLRDCLMPPRWVVSCPECSEEFTHTEIRTMANGSMRDVFASPPKPQIPESGTPLRCRQCGKTSTYRAFDLRYRPD
jgi:hypothetical protein